ARVVLLLAALLFGSSVARAPTAPRAPQKKQPSEQDVLQQHYEAARTFQLSGDAEHASVEYRAFLAGALRSSSRVYFRLGQLDRAASLFDEALRIAPNDSEVLLDYAQLRFQQDKLSDARALVEKALVASPDNARAQSL